MPKENIQQTFQDLYARAKNHEVFTDLMSIVLNRENILLAYRNIKSNSGSDTRPLGIPCIWDRLIQQCFKQVLEPICEAHFSKHSYGFRPNRSVEHAMADVSRKLQTQNLHYVIEFDIKGFFDNVNHSKLISQMWTLGIRDKHLLGKIRRILKVPVKLGAVGKPK